MIKLGKVPIFFVLLLSFLTISYFFTLLYAEQPAEKAYSCFVMNDCPVFRECVGYSALKYRCTVICKDASGHWVGGASCNTPVY